MSERRDEHSHLELIFPTHNAPDSMDELAKKKLFLALFEKKLDL